MKKKLAILLILANWTHVSYNKLIIGDPNAADNTTFSFTVGFVKYEDKTQNSFPRFWTATDDPNIANMADDTKKYGLSLINQAPSYLNSEIQIQAIPMTNSGDALIFENKNSTVTSITEPNPMWGAAFKLFDIGLQKPIFVLQDQTNFLYSVHNIEHYEASKKENITQLLRYDFGTGKNVNALKSFLNGIYTAYSDGDFGTTPSYIALLENSKIQDENNSKIINPYLNFLASAPVGLDTTALIGGPGKPNLQSLGTSIGIDIVSNRIFFYTQAQAGVSGIAFPIAQIFLTQDKNNSKNLLFGLLAPENVITQDTVISATNSNTIRITAVKLMYTSTNLPYMIIARDQGTGPQTIYALPLINKGVYTGMIADYSSVTTKFGTFKPTFIERYFTHVLSDQSQIDPNNTALLPQLKVGGLSDLPISSTHDIKQIYVVGDSIYAVIDQEYSTQDAPGTYRSQAILSSQGYIIGWTPWSRVLGSDKQMNYSFVDFKYLTGLYVAAQAPSSTPQFKSIYQTTFTHDSNLSAFLLAALGVGGIQGIFNFNQQTQGFNNALSMLIATAFNKVTIGQTGYLNNAIFKVMPNPNIVEFSDDSIHNHGALIAAEIAHDTNNNHYIFAGGVTGVSVLSNNTTGVSWNGNLNSVNDLDSNEISWKKIVDVPFVKKLVWDTNYLYILTSTHLYRIQLEPNKFTLNPTEKLNIETVLKGTDLGASTYFLDAIIDNGYALLGTTSGLYQFSGKAIKINLPGGLPAVSQITAIAPNNNPSHSFKNLSNIYVLNNTFGTEQAKIYRLVIQDETVQMLPDQLVALKTDLYKGIPTAFITFDYFISSYFTDGSWNTAQSYYAGPNQPENSGATPFVVQLQAGIRSGQSSSQVIMPMLTNRAPLPFLKLATNLLNLIRESTSGELIVAGDFQAYTNA